jgi:hypothetical protein
MVDYSAKGLPNSLQVLKQSVLTAIDLKHIFYGLRMIYNSDILVRSEDQYGFCIDQ